MDIEFVEHMIENHMLGDMKVKHVQIFSALFRVLSLHTNNWAAFEDTYPTLERYGVQLGITHVDSDILHSMPSPFFQGAILAPKVRLMGPDGENF